MEQLIRDFKIGPIPKIVFGYFFVLLLSSCSTTSEKAPVPMFDGNPVQSFTEKNFEINHSAIVVIESKLRPRLIEKSKQKPKLAH
jgi:hypothetical protein